MNNKKMKVAANFDDFAEERDIILTIQDRGILDADEADDEILENPDFIKVQKDKKGYQYVRNPTSFPKYHSLNLLPTTT